MSRTPLSLGREPRRLVLTRSWLRGCLGLSALLVGACNGLLGIEEATLRDGGSLADGGPADGLDQLDGGGGDAEEGGVGCDGVNQSAGAGPSCAALAATCGPSQNGDCCAWNEVP